MSDRKCMHCTTAETSTHRLKNCGRCKMVAYCNTTCQHADWPAHKLVCNKHDGLRLGYAGKSCIHPSQVALANEAFRPGDEEIAHALRVTQAAADAQARGVGAFLVDGRMIDRPFLLRARAIVALAQRLGLLPRA